VKDGALGIRTNELIPGGVFRGIEWPDLNIFHLFVLPDEIQEGFLDCAVSLSP